MLPEAFEWKNVLVSARCCLIGVRTETYAGYVKRLTCGDDWSGQLAAWEFAVAVPGGPLSIALEP